MGSLTLCDYFVHILPRLEDQEMQDIPVWPPDVFALCAGALMRSGGYSHVLTGWPPRCTSKQEALAYEAAIVDSAEEWREAWCRATNSGQDVEAPECVDKLWEGILSSWDSPLCDLANNLTLLQDVTELMAIADEACKGMGLYPTGDNADVLVTTANLQLFTNPSGATLCDEIHPSRLRTLPKVHTPQNGLTIRSLSHYVAVCPPTEVRPMWSLVPDTFPTCMNVLVVPWPFEVFPKQFFEADADPLEMLNMPEQFGFFGFRHEASEIDSENVVAVVLGLLKAAERQVGRVDLVILPELSVSEAESDQLASALREQGCSLVCGFGTAPQENRPGSNCAKIVFTTSPEHQSKHHRWKLDQAQLRQYSLASQLHAERQWWEYIPLKDRQLQFTALGDNLVLCVLICEDLARPDPVGDLLRAVGPSLIVSLLMDGPQLKERWSSRYATVLADDPGSSVLTVTSLGMSLLSRGQTGNDRSRIIALWKDIRSGSPEELELPLGAEALVLSLAMRKASEWTADGRCDRRTMIFPTLSGVRPVSRNKEVLN